MFLSPLPGYCCCTPANTASTAQHAVTHTHMSKRTRACFQLMWPPCCNAQACYIATAGSAPHSCQLCTASLPLFFVQYFLLRNADSDPLAMGQFILAIAFASSAVTIVSGALAERCKLFAYFVFAAVMSGFTYPIIAHWCASHPGLCSCVVVLHALSRWLLLCPQAHCLSDDRAC